MSDTDLQLLARYTRQRAEDAFAEIVRRHLGLVYSAALRQVRSPQLAEEVSQSVFADLARAATELKEDTILTAWLYQVTRRTAIDVVRREIRRQLREQIATEMNAMNATTDDWTHIEPLLDEAMSALDETDRAAVLLRYFENKSLREIGATFGTTDDAAQKRVSRAVERLREFLAKRGVTVGASGLVVVISANAVQAAPAGLAAAISTVAVAGTTIATTTTAAVTKAIAMTTLQKTMIGATLAATVGFGIYEAKQVAQLREQARSSQPPQTAGISNSAGDAKFQERIRQFESENENLTQTLARATADKARLETEREQARRSAALFKELADQASAQNQNSTNEYPSARHTLVGFGKLAKRLAQLSEQGQDQLTPEEKTANDELQLNLVMDAIKLSKVAKQYGLEQEGPNSVNNDPADSGACFLYGALGLNEQQFSGVYSVMQKYREPAVQPNLSGEEPAPEIKAATKRLEEQARLEVQSLLSEEQVATFKLILPHLQLIDPDSGRAAFAYSLADRDDSQEADK